MTKFSLSLCLLVLPPQIPKRSKALQVQTYVLKRRTG
jgi:hypothetical protein